MPHDTPSSPSERFAKNKNTEKESSSQSVSSWAGLRSFRNRWLWFLLLSCSLHALSVAPWPQWIRSVLSLIGIQSTTSWTDFDAPTVIPIDITSLDDEPEPTAPPKSNAPEIAAAPVSASSAKQTLHALDAAVDAASQLRDSATHHAVDAHTFMAIIDASPSNESSASDSQVSDALHELESDAASDAGSAKPGLRDPNALSGALASLQPTSKEVNVSFFLRTDHLRKHPLGHAIGKKLILVAQWKPFFEGTGLNPIDDIDVIQAYGPRFHETSRITALIVHSKPEDEMRIKMRVIAMRDPKSVQIGTEEIPAFRANLDQATRVFVQMPGGILITPLDGEKQALLIAKQLIEKKANARMLVPKSDADLIVSAYMRQPSNVLGVIPPTLHDAKGIIRMRKDFGAVIDVEAQSKDAQQAKADTQAIKSYISELTGNLLIGLAVNPYIQGHSLEAQGNSVRVHHELDFEKVKGVWGLANTFMF